MMLRRKKTPPYLIYSLLIHVALLLATWWLVPQQDPLLPAYREGVRVFITHLKPPPPPMKPPLFVEPVAPTPAVEEQPPAPPKPKASTNTRWQNVDRDKTDPAPAIRKQKHTRYSPEIGTSTQPPTNYVVENRLIVEGFTQPIAVPLKPPKTEYAAPHGETRPITLETDDTLMGAGASPAVDTPQIYYGSQRGDVLRVTGMGNTWNTGATSGSGAIGGAFVYMMKDIAHILAEAATAKRVDIVFVLDETASMSDNIRGIRAYVDFLFETLEREGHEVTFGLVTFTDKTKKYGSTVDLGTFKNWLFKIGVDGGGDITEAGLDALMAAVKTTKFHTSAQRFIILASDGAFHDADYNGRSDYSLDEVIETLQNERVRVDVIGIDYLPIRQIALATGGTWRAIPGRGYLEYVPPLTLTVKLFSKLGTLNVKKGQIHDKIIVYLNNTPRSKQVTLTRKVLNPLGERCYGPFTEKKTISDDSLTEVELTSTLDSEIFRRMPGVYTIIYRLENEHGHRSILRRTLTF